MFDMADNETPAIATSTESAPASAPVATESAAPATTPAPSASDAPASTPQSDAAAAPAVEAAAPSAAAPSLLGTEPTEEVKPEVKPEAKTEAKPEDKKVEEKKPEGEKSAEGEKTPEAEVKPEGEQVELPKYEAFKLPEGFETDEKAMGEFTGLLGQLELAKGDHVKTQEVGQKMTDMFIAEMGKHTQRLTDFYKMTWEKQKATDFETLQKDAVFGGDAPKMEKNARELANFLARSGGSKEEVTAFRKFVQERGVDNALPIIRVMNNLKSKIDMYEKENTKMLPGTKPGTSTSNAPGKNILGNLYGKKA